MRAKRARVKKKEQNKSRNRVGGFAVPYAYAQQQLKRASEHLQVALALFPLGAEANEMMGLVFLQANDGHAAIKSFDAVASQGLPVLFFAEMRGHKLDHAVKCELTRDRLRFIFLFLRQKRHCLSSFQTRRRRRPWGYDDRTRRRTPGVVRCS